MGSCWWLDGGADESADFGRRRLSRGLSGPIEIVDASRCLSGPLGFLGSVRPLPSSASSGSFECLGDHGPLASLRSMEA